MFTYIILEYNSVRRPKRSGPVWKCPMAMALYVNQTYPNKKTSPILHFFQTFKFQNACLNYSSTYILDFFRTAKNAPRVVEAGQKMEAVRLCMATERPCVEIERSTSVGAVRTGVKAVRSSVEEAMASQKMEAIRTSTGVEAVRTGKEAARSSLVVAMEAAIYESNWILKENQELIRSKLMCKIGPMLKLSFLFVY